MSVARQLRKLADRMTPGASARSRGLPARLRQCFDRLAQEYDVRTVLDVGANRGEFAKAAAERFPGAVVHAFEPLESCAEKLQALEASHPNVRAHRFALGDSPGEVELFESDFTPASSMLAMSERCRELWPKAAAGRRTTAPMETLDRLDARLGFEPAVFLKLDIQGYEMFALRGGDGVVRRSGAVLTEVNFEPLYEGQATFRALVDFLGDRGLEFAEFVVEARKPPDQRMLYADALFLNPRLRRAAP